MHRTEEGHAYRKSAQAAAMHRARGEKNARWPDPVRDTRDGKVFISRRQITGAYNLRVELRSRTGYGFYAMALDGWNKWAIARGESRDDALANLIKRIDPNLKEIRQCVS